MSAANSAANSAARLGLKMIRPVFMRVKGCCKVFCCKCSNLAARFLRMSVFMRLNECCKVLQIVLQVECCKGGYIYTPPLQQYRLVLAVAACAWKKIAMRTNDLKTLNVSESVRRLNPELFGGAVGGLPKPKPKRGPRRSDAPQDGHEKGGAGSMGSRPKPTVHLVAKSAGNHLLAIWPMGGSEK